MKANLEAQAAITRHPAEAAQVIAKVGATDENGVEWSYDAYTRIDGSFSIANQLKGIDRFIHNAGNHGLSLVGRLIGSPKKRHSVELDTIDLTTDPARCPHEIWGSMHKPEGPSIWIWRPRAVSAPGWNEAVIVGGITNGENTLLRLYEDHCYEGGTVLLEKCKGTPGWRETSRDASGRVDTFGSALQASMGQYSVSGELKGATPASTKALASSGIRELTKDEIQSIHEEFPGGHMVGPDAIAKLGELFSALRQGGALSKEALQVPNDDMSLWERRIKMGRHFKWGESIDLDELSDYQALMQNTGVSSGNALQVFMSHANPSFQNNREIASMIISELAMGKSREDALAEATSRVASKPAPSPTAKWGF